MTEPTKVDKFRLNDTDEDVLFTIIHEPSYAYEIAKKCSIAPATVYKSTGKLEAAGLIRSYPEGRKRIYKLSNRWTCANGTFVCILRDRMSIVYECPFLDSCTNVYHLDKNCMLLRKNPEIQAFIDKLMSDK